MTDGANDRADNGLDSQQSGLCLQEVSYLCVVSKVQRDVSLAHAADTPTHAQQEQG